MPFLKQNSTVTCTVKSSYKKETVIHKFDREAWVILFVKIQTKKLYCRSTERTTAGLQDNYMLNANNEFSSLLLEKMVPVTNSAFLHPAVVVKNHILHSRFCQLPLVGVVATYPVMRHVFARTLPAAWAALFSGRPFQHSSYTSSWQELLFQQNWYK